jgi:hypothetical protein
MTPELVRQAQAELRRAFTQATVAFPLLNITPIQIALYKAYADAAYFVGDTFVLQDPDIGAEIMALTMQAQKQLVAKEAADQILRGFAAEDGKRIRSLVSGLDANKAQTLVNMHRSGNSPTQLKLAKEKMLSDRRNMLANELTVQAIQKALNRFKQTSERDAVILRAEPDAV